MSLRRMLSFQRIEYLPGQRAVFPGERIRPIERIKRIGCRLCRSRNANTRRNGRKGDREDTEEESGI